MSSKSFALITEGASEHQVIKHILQNYLDEEPEVNQIQPQLLDDKQNSVGGWNEVLKYCERENELLEILKYNDFIVIQIDTDMCETAPYSVPRNENGHQLTMDELWLRVHDRIMDALPNSVDKSRVIVAICSETIECWLLPVCCTRPVDQRHTNQCLSHLNDELRRMNMHIITDKNSEQSRGIYQAVLKRMRKPIDIKAASSFHYGFGQFLEQLDEIQ